MQRITTPQVIGAFAAVWACGAVVLYLIAAFAAWSLNPAEWEPVIRLAWAGLAVAWGWCLASALGCDCGEG